MVRRNTPKAAKTDANPDTKETPSSTRTSRAKKASESEASASDITDTTDASAVNHDTKETDVDTGKSEDAVASKATPKKRRGSTKTTTGTDMETSTDVNVSMYKAGDGVDETVQVDKADGDGVSAIDMDVDVNADTNASISTDTVTETQAEVGANAEVDTTKKEGKTSRKGDKKNKKDNKVNKKQSGKRDKGGSQQVQDGKKGPPKDPLLGAGPKAPILANPVMPMNMPMNVPGGVPMRPPMQHMGMNTHTHPRAHMQPLPHTAHPHTRGPRPGAPQRGNGPKMGANGPKTGANGPKMGARKGPGAVVQPHLLTKKEPLTKKEVKDKTVDALAKMAQATWGDKSNVKFRAETVTKIYREHILGTQFSSHRLQVLEINQYLERYLWPNYKPDSKDKTHVLSLCVMINEKFRQGVPAWDAMIGVTSCDGEVDEAPAGDAKSDNQERFSAFMAEVRNLTVEASEDVSMAELARLVQLHVNLSKSLENSVVRQEVLPCVSLGVWTHVTDVRRQKELKQSSRIARQWKTLNKRLKKLDDTAKAKRMEHLSFIPRLVQRFLDTVRTFSPAQAQQDLLTHTTHAPTSKHSHTIHFCERVLEYLIDLQSQLPTRRYTNLLLLDRHVVITCSRSVMFRTLGPNSLCAQLMASLTFYLGFEINNLTGLALTEKEMTANHYQRVRETQIMAFQHQDDFPELEEFSLSNVASVDSAQGIAIHMGKLSVHALQSFLHLLGLVASPEETVIDDHTLLLAIIVDYLQTRTSQITALNETALYPSEQTLFDPNVVPDEYYSEGVLALPKLNLQFLTFHDYLLRNLNLFRLESTFEIREDIIDSVKRMPARLDGDNLVQFDGWSRMAMPTSDFSIIEVAKPELGHFRPRRVRADITIDLRLCRPAIAAEWEGLRRHDILFLCCVQPPAANPFAPEPQTTGHKHQNTKLGYDPVYFMERTGLRFVRGCEVEGMLDESGSIIEDGPEKPEFKGSTRTLRVYLDTNQYYQDIQALNNGGVDIYGGVNLLMRRQAKENNFKAVLETIRNLMNVQCLVPEWLHDVFLGYGDPAMAHYRHTEMKQPTRTFNVNDTFVDIKHLKRSFPSNTIECVVPEDSPECVPPFNIKLPDPANEDDKAIIVTPFNAPNMGPYPSERPRGNTIYFTPVQTEAIVSAMHHGLTMVVGPPGTGKTDVAVQIISNWYHNTPDQRILLVTHSNMALNQLFEKLMGLDIDERHLLRLGYGERELDTEKIFSKFGRVEHILERRLQLLQHVQRLAETLGVQGDVGASCETAQYFYLHSIMSRWEEYLSKVKRGADSETELLAAVSKEFPFAKYFEDALEEKMFNGKDYADDIDVAEGCYRHLCKIFEELEGCRAFEIMRTNNDRVNYLLAKEAKIVAMTCTHAALKRDDLVKAGFNFDNILMEEAAQILEIETFIPMMCQDPSPNRLKRVVLIGDHHQLPPVIKNMAFQKFSNMEQSMFTRFIRLNVPAVHLDAQGRARSSIAQLYSWRYKKLDNLPHVQALPEFTYGNAGFKYDYQFIDVGPFNEQGETEPTPHFIQNLGEAEYVVATYMFMRLLGYAAEKISVITTYNGQAALLRDVFTARCGQSGSLYGMPAAIATVDKFQGQQNDYVLLSLVRTKTIGHIRDVRRLVVALSRARLGLYVFGRLSMFKDCFELQNAMDLLVKRPTTLQLVLGETYPCGRKNTNHAKKNVKGIEDVVAMHEYVAGVASQMNRQLDAYSQQASKAEQALPEDKQPQDPADPATVTDDTATQAESVESSRMEGTNTESDVANGVAEGGESVSGGAMDVDGPTDEIPTSEAMETDGVKPEGTVTGAVAESVADGEVVDKTAANDV